MLSPLCNETYRRLFIAQVIALLGTGLATVALGLLAFELAGNEAGAVLGTALAIKMLAYVFIAPVANAVADRVPRRALLVAMDLLRACIALALPFVDQIWQIYLLIFVLQSASAAFTPAFQAVIPEILPDEEEYTKALSLSRLAYDLESLASPVLAAALLSLISFHWLFGGTALGFIISALLVVSTTLPRVSTTLPLAKPDERHKGVLERTVRGLRVYLATPRLRGLLALNLAVSAAGAMVIVNSVVYVQALLGRPETDVALAYAVFGGGSMLAALNLPRLLRRLTSRTVMLSAAALLVVALLVTGALSLFGLVGWSGLLVCWFVLGLGFSAAQTPAGRLIRRSAGPSGRPALFAAQFALSHACWLVAYPLAGWLGVAAGMPVTLLVLGGLAVLGTVLAWHLWPADDPEIVEHVHHDLPIDHPHVRGAIRTGEGLRHAHTYVIDDDHRHWYR